ncbi:uncharacterized protein LOC143233597 [Tachypleus tridentatus]|uniref:uncharacterized protein LOC143233597 n=1 Tax=Tachypleus tridentatus TaxID=6853 RepID=UPI003FD20E6D
MPELIRNNLPRGFTIMRKYFLLPHLLCCMQVLLVIFNTAVPVCDCHTTLWNISPKRFNVGSSKNSNINHANPSSIYGKPRTQTVDEESVAISEPSSIITSYRRRHGSSPQAFQISKKDIMPFSLEDAISSGYFTQAWPISIKSPVKTKIHISYEADRTDDGQSRYQSYAPSTSSHPLGSINNHNVRFRLRPSGFQSSLGDSETFLPSKGFTPEPQDYSWNDNYYYYDWPFHSHNTDSDGKGTIGGSIGGSLEGSNPGTDNDMMVYDKAGGPSSFSSSKSHNKQSIPKHQSYYVSLSDYNNPKRLYTLSVPTAKTQLLLNETSYATKSVPSVGSMTSKDTLFLDDKTYPSVSTVHTLSTDENDHTTTKHTRISSENTKNRVRNNQISRDHFRMPMAQKKNVNSNVSGQVSTKYTRGPLKTGNNTSSNILTKYIKDLPQHTIRNEGNYNVWQKYPFIPIEDSTNADKNNQTSIKYTRVSWKQPTDTNDNHKLSTEYVRISMNHTQTTNGHSQKSTKGTKVPKEHTSTVASYHSMASNWPKWTKTVATENVHRISSTNGPDYISTSNDMQNTTNPHVNTEYTLGAVRRNNSSIILPKIPDVTRKSYGPDIIKNTDFVGTTTRKPAIQEPTIYGPSSEVVFIDLRKGSNPPITDSKSANAHDSLPKNRVMTTFKITSKIRKPSDHLYPFSFTNNQPHEAVKSSENIFDMKVRPGFLTTIRPLWPLAKSSHGQLDLLNNNLADISSTSSNPPQEIPDLEINPTTSEADDMVPNQTDSNINDELVIGIVLGVLALALLAVTVITITYHKVFCYHWKQMNNRRSTRVPANNIVFSTCSSRASSRIEIPKPTTEEMTSIDSDSTQGSLDSSISKKYSSNTSKNTKV